MSCDGYTSSALMGNWFEDRQADKQTSKIKPEKKVTREDNDIKFIADTNEVKNLSKIARKPKWETKAVVQDYGYREFMPLSKDSFRKQLNDNYFSNKDLRPIKNKTENKPQAEKNDEHMLTRGGEKVKMISSRRNPHQQFVKRKFPMNVTDFYSTLKNHDENHKKFFGMTTYQEAYKRKNSKIPNSSRIFKNSIRSLRGRSAGVTAHSNRNKLKGKKMNTFLIGEKYRDYEDPKMNVHSQRTWVYGKDKTLDAVEKNLNFTLSKLGGRATRESVMSSYKRTAFPKFKKGDGPNSLPIENGENEFFPRLNHRGAYRRVRSQVTREMNKPLGYK